MNDPLSSLSEKPNRLKGLSWFLFSGTAMFSAFVLPVIFFVQIGGWTLRLENNFVNIFLILVVFCGLYHGLYRTTTILFDFGFARAAKIAGWIFLILGLPLFIRFVFLIFAAHPTV